MANSIQINFQKPIHYIQILPNPENYILNMTLYTFTLVLHMKTSQHGLGGTIGGLWQVSHSKQTFEKNMNKFLYRWTCFSSPYLCWLVTQTNWRLSERPWPIRRWGCTIAPPRVRPLTGVQRGSSPPWSLTWGPPVPWTTWLREQQVQMNFSLHSSQLKKELSFISTLNILSFVSSNKYFMVSGCIISRIMNSELIIIAK